MPIDWTNLPDKGTQASPSGIDFSNLPDKGDGGGSGGTNHPVLAAITRLLGGVGSSLASPADITVAGTAIPAAIAGGSESLAEWLEGSPQSAARIGTEAAIGMVPFAKMVKDGKLVANMGKAALLGGVGEGAREKAQGEDLSPLHIAGSAALNAGTFGLMHRFFGGGKPTAPAGPGSPAMSTPPVIEPQPGNKVFQMPADWETRVTGKASPDNAVRGDVQKLVTAAKQPTMAPSTVGQHNFASDVRNTLGKAVGKVEGAADHLDDLDSGIQDATKMGSARRAANFRAEVQGTNQENAAHLQEIRRVLGMKNAEQLRQQRINAGLEPSTTFSESESGVDATGKRITKNTKFAPPDEEGAGGGGVDENDSDPSELVLDPTEHAPFGGARLPIEPPAKAGEWPAGAQSVVPKVQVPSAEPPSPVEALSRVLKPRRSVKTPEGFNAAVEKNLANWGDPAIPPENVAPGATSSVAGPIAAEPTKLESLSPDLNNASKLNSLSQGGENTTPDGNPLAKFFKTKTGATGYNYRMAKDAAKSGEIPSADFARDSHLIQLGKGAEGPLAGPPAPRTPTDLLEQVLQMSKPKQTIDWPEVGGKMEMNAEGSHTLAPIEGGTVETPVNPDAGAAGADDAPEWIRKANEELEAMKKDPGQRGAIAPGLMRLLAGGTGAVVGAPVGQYLDPDDPNAGVKGAIAGGLLGYGATGGASELINMRNAGLLATPSAQLKKPLSDMGAYVGKGLESAMSGNVQQAAAMGREAFNPVNFSNYAKAWKNPRLAEDVIGDTARPHLEPTQWPLSWIAKPFAAAQYATAQAMQRAGVSPDEARNVLLLGKPQTQLAQRWLDLQKLPGWQGQAVRAIRPFARIGTNIFERGVQRIPGVSMMTGDPETRVGRTILGLGAMGAGALTGASDTGDEEQGAEPTSPLVRGLRRAMLASYGVPFVLGESLTGPRGIRDLVYMTPGATETVPPPAPKDNIFTYGKKFGKRWIDQMLPDWLNPEDVSTGSSPAQR